MFVKNLGDCEEFTANDGCHIRELLHPENDPVNLPYSIAIASVGNNKNTYKHVLIQAEVYYILAGHGLMHIDDEMREIKQGDVILIPPGSIQWLENNGDTEIWFMAIVSPPWTNEGDKRID